MKTPITDKLNMAHHEDDAASFVKSYMEMRDLARKLELDRASLMEALSHAQCMTLNLVSDAKKNKPWHPDAAANLRSAADAMQDAIAAARANFPETE